MDTLPEEIQNIIFKYKHQIEFKRVVRELNCMGMCAVCFGRTCCKVERCYICGYTWEEWLVEAEERTSDEEEDTDSDSDSDWTDSDLDYGLYWG